MPRVIECSFVIPEAKVRFAPWGFRLKLRVCPLLSVSGKNATGRSPEWPRQSLPRFAILSRRHQGRQLQTQRKCQQNTSS